MNKYVIDTQALIKFLNGVKVINENIDLLLRKTDEGENNYYPICSNVRNRLSA